MASEVIGIENLSRVYRNSGGVSTQALTDVSLSVTSGEMVAIMGASGSGKSTLMNVLGLLDQGFSGIYRLNGADVRGISGSTAAQLRSTEIGFVFQQFNLLRRTSVLNNVLLPALYHKGPKPTARALDLIERVGLAAEVGKRSNQLSGGQMQRVAIARALLYEPKVLLADEPTGNLDSQTANEIMAIIRAINAAGSTVVLITHEEDVAAHAGRRIRLRDGRVIEDSVAAA
ncbi:MAG: ABC transporter ATP-binding protein [Candidatus Nanopelagicales bacterium]